MKVNVSAINDDVKPALNGVTVASYKLGDLVDSLAILFIVIGAFIFIVSGLGLFGACCEVKCMLVTVSIPIFIQIYKLVYKKSITWLHHLFYVLKKSWKIFYEKVLNSNLLFCIFIQMFIGQEVNSLTKDIDWYLLLQFTLIIVLSKWELFLKIFI